MKRIATILLVLALSLVATTATAQPRYAWTITRSPIDENEITGPVASGLVRLYLWLNCSSQGMYAAEFGVSVSPGNTVLEFKPANGFLNAGSATALLLMVAGCPSAPLLVGSFLILKTTPSDGRGPLDMCFTGANVTVDCESQTAWPHAFAGFSEFGDPCIFPHWPLCDVTSKDPTSLNPSSWGSLKSLYR